MLHTLCSHSPQKEVFPTTSGSRALPSLLTYIALPEPVFMCSFLLDSRQWFQELQSLLCLPRLGRRRPGYPPGLLWASRPAPSQPPASGGGDSWDGAGRRPRSRPESGVTSPSEGPLVLRALTPASRALSPPEASPQKKSLRLALGVLIGRDSRVCFLSLVDTQQSQGPHMEW